MSSVEGRLTRLIDEAIDRERQRIEQTIHEAADRILADRLSALGVTEVSETGEWLDRETIQEEYGVPYWKIRDAQVSGQMYSVRRGRKVLSKREDVDSRFKRVA
jgi:hypothetical protein